MIYKINSIFDNKIIRGCYEEHQILLFFFNAKHQILFISRT